MAKTKQEKIRDWMEKEVISILVLYGEPLQSAREIAKELVGKWLKTLDLGGVVIKVEGELPQRDRYSHYPNIIDAIQQDMLKAGYTLTERLV